MDKSTMMERQKYNRMILELLKKDEFFEFHMSDEKAEEVYDVLEDAIREYPNQRFGQILCNYIDFDNPDITSMLFYKSRTSDPFYEESKSTYNRLVKLKADEI